jgi:hypothetical protein
MKVSGPSMRFLDGWISVTESLAVALSFVPERKNPSLSN